MAEFQISSMVRGYHAYKDVWQASSGDILQCGREVSNRHDPYAVAVKKSGVIVGHVPRRISTICSLFLRRGGLIQCTVTGSRRYSEDLPQGGLEIPCGLTFKIDRKDVLEKTQNLLGRVSRNEASAKSAPLTSDIPEPKRSRIEVQNEESSQLEIWVSGLPNGLVLRQLEKNILLNGNELTDMHVNAFQVLLKEKFPRVRGLFLTFAPSSVGGWTDNYIQILHCNGNHWITVSTVNCANDVVNVYDSLYTSITEETKDNLAKIFSTSVKYYLPRVQIQKGAKDCGLFAMAFASYLAHGNDPRLLQHCWFDQGCLRSTLLDCFEQKSVSDFQYYAMSV